MIKVTYSSPLTTLKRIKIGDEIIDDYDSKGCIVKINEVEKGDITEFTFSLDNRQIIFIISSSASY